MPGQGMPGQGMPGQGMQMPGMAPPFLPGAGAGFMGLGVPLEMGEAPPLSGRSQGDLRQLWQMVTQVDALPLSLL